MLASEYVLGTLRGSARRRFESLMRTRAEWRAAVRWWSERLHLIADTVPGVRPHHRVWRNIELKLFGPHLASMLDWWRGLAIISSAIAVALALFVVSEVLLKQPETGLLPPTNVAVLTDKQARSAWMLKVELTEAGTVLKVAALTGLNDVPDKAFELWVLPPDNAKPVSLGLLPKQGEAQSIVPGDAAGLLIPGSLAVSVEPPGGSPTGQPTGPVLYQGKLKQI